ncbi:Aldedh-domain-containing protein [Auriscalpium vulgare]|uniref:Aldedh-domain-containing protein n=1 Tax=Auriscalpium vulgare TaxID=40419 RepID=A0ACB8RSB3_9AGAM|nr:Aldedh-domain-containing protein [Auriscalpium vulgare]
MGALLSFLIHPFDTLRRRRNEFDEGNIDDLLYHLTLFFAFGIYTVFRRYQNAKNKAVNFHVAPLEAAKPNWTGHHIANAHLNSHRYDAQLLPPIGEAIGRDYITCFDPATGLHLDTILADNIHEIGAKIDKAAAAQLKWKKTTFADRRRVVRSLKKWLVENQELCAQTACRDTGKTLVDAALGEILTTCSKMDFLLSHGEKYLRPETRSNPPMMFYKKSQVHYEPLGVVAAIVSWNYPLHNAWSPILAAIFAGNGIVLKCSENVVWSSQWFVRAIQECIRACGFDPELVQLACCYPDQAEGLTRSPKIKHITFIGSEFVGRQVAVAATTHLTPVNLELGGKDPAIVLPGTDVDKWASIWMRGIFQNAGQNCIGIERMIVHNSIYDDVYQTILDRARSLTVGAGLSASTGVGTSVDVGSMISQTTVLPDGQTRDRFQELTDIVNKARDAGAKIELGGERYDQPYLTHGAYFKPTVVGDVTPDMDIAQHELFAPVAVLIPYETIEEAIEIANGTKYALGASVFGPDKYQALEVAKALECGMVSINDFGVFYVNLPFGGTKGSGYGRFGGPEGIRSLTNPKAVVVDRWPWLIQTSIPRQLDYPIQSPTLAWEFVSGLTGLFYADGWRGRLESLRLLMNANRR